MSVVAILIPQYSFFFKLPSLDDLGGLILYAVSLIIKQIVKQMNK